MRLISTVIATFIVGLFSLSGASMAQQGITPQTVQDLDTAILGGDTGTINGIILQNQGNPVALGQIANILLSAAQATKAAGNEAGGAMLAALALTSGGLSGAPAILALTMVQSNPTVMSFVTNPNGVNVGGNPFTNTGNNIFVLGPQSPASNPLQTGGTKTGTQTTGSPS
jgi:hypothetical protein